MTKNQTHTLLIVALSMVILFIIIGVSVSEREQARKCKELGGVIVRTYGHMNCASEGYIEIR